MGLAKSIEVRPIRKADADRVVRALHYSGKVDPRSQLHFGVFYQGSCHGAMQFGPSIDKSKTITLVAGTPWNGFLELNRMAFADTLPRNSESRALGIAFRLIRKAYPHIKWIVSFADGTQCGDGTIYRAAGFLLTQVKPNKSMWRMPDGEVVCQLSFTIGGSGTLRRRYGYQPTDTFSKFAKRIGAQCIPGYQLRYLKFIDESYRERLVCKPIPFSEIERIGATMYRGERITRAREAEASMRHSSTMEIGGSSPTSALQKSD